MNNFDDRGLILINLLDVSLPSVCGIFRSDPSGAQHCDREPDSNVIDAVVPEVLLLPPRCWVTAVLAAGVTGALCLM